MILNNKKFSGTNEISFAADMEGGKAVYFVVGFKK